MCALFSGLYIGGDDEGGGGGGGGGCGLAKEGKKCVFNYPQRPAESLEKLVLR